MHIGVPILAQGDNFAVRCALDRLHHTLFQHRLAVFIGQCGFHRHLGKTKKVVFKHLGFHRQVVIGINRIGKALVGFQDELDAGFVQIHALGTDVFAAFHKAFAGVDQLYTPAALHRLALGQHPDIGGNAGVVKQVGGQLYNGFHKVLMDKIAANLGRTAARITGKQRGAVLDNCHSAGAGFQLFHAVEHKQHLTVRHGGQTGTETPVIAALGFGLHLRFLAFPVDAEGRVGNDIVKLIVAEGILA